MLGLPGRLWRGHPGFPRQVPAHPRHPPAHQTYHSPRAIVVKLVYVSPAIAAAVTCSQRSCRRHRSCSCAGGPPEPRSAPPRWSCAGDGRGGWLHQGTNLEHVLGVDALGRGGASGEVAPAQDVEVGCRRPGGKTADGRDKGDQGG